MVHSKCCMPVPCCSPCCQQNGAACSLRLLLISSGDLGATCNRCVDSHVVVERPGSQGMCRTALMARNTFITARVCLMQMMELLMDRGSAADAPNKQGWTALHRAAYTGYAAACRLMLRRGAGLNAVTREGRTALHLAALQVCRRGWRSNWRGSN